MTPGLEGPVSRGRVWDPLVRLFHWSLAAAFATAWFERSEAAIHETAGRIVLVLVIVRAAWGLTGPASARFETFVKGPVATVQYIWSILSGRPRHYLGHNPAGAAMIGMLLLSLAVAAGSGILMSTTALWGNGWIEWVHGTSATVCVWLIAGHLLGILIASAQHRENLPLSMVTGKKWVPSDAASYLGKSRFSAGRLLLAAMVVGVSASTWAASVTLLNASFWRMEKIVAAEAKKLGCDVAAVGAPQIEIYPEFKLRYDVSFAGEGGKATAEVPASTALERRPKLDLPAIGTACLVARKIEPLDSDGTALSGNGLSVAIAPEAVIAPPSALTAASARPPGIPVFTAVPPREDDTPHLPQPAPDIVIVLDPSANGLPVAVSTSPLAGTQAEAAPLGQTSGGQTGFLPGPPIPASKPTAPVANSSETAVPRAKETTASRDAAQAPKKFRDAATLRKAGKKAGARARIKAAITRTASKTNRVEKKKKQKRRREGRGHFSGVEHRRAAPSSRGEGGDHGHGGGDDHGGDDNDDNSGSGSGGNSGSGGGGNSGSGGGGNSGNGGGGGNSGSGGGGNSGSGGGDDD
jgi:cytochrome b